MLDLLRALLRAESVFDLRDSTMAAFSELGFSAAYYVSPVVQDRSEGRMMINMGFPLEWERAYGSAARVGFVGLGKPLKPDGFETADLDLLRIAAETSYLRYCELIVADADDIPRLSTRELDVLHWMAQGKSNAAIARQLELGQETVDTYVRRIFTKLNVSDRTSAVVKGVTRGLVIASEPKIDAAIQARQPRKTPEGGAE